MTREEFTAQYEKHSRMTDGQALDLGLRAHPCDCGLDNCKGWQWQMLSDISIKHQPTEKPMGTITVHELKDAPGRFRVAGPNPEKPEELDYACVCEGGHESEEAARECPQALAKLKEIVAKQKKDQPKREVLDIAFVAARAAHAANRAYCQSLGDDSQLSWVETTEDIRVSAIVGVQSIQQHPDVTPAQLHSLWMAHKGADGWVYGEAKDVEAKTHPCMVPFAELPKEQQFKDSLFHAVVTGALGL